MVQAYLHRFLKYYSDLMIALPELRHASKDLREEQVGDTVLHAHPVAGVDKCPPCTPQSPNALVHGVSIKRVLEA